MFDVLLDTLLDTGKMLPFLFAVYLLMEWVERCFPSFSPDRWGKLGPLAGALAGCVPQCGFSAAAAALYNQGALGAGTLIAVFLSTSDEALPLLLSHTADLSSILTLLAAKISIAVLFGYFFQFAWFGKKVSPSSLQRANSPLQETKSSCSCHRHSSSLLGAALFHTLQIALFVLGALLCINLLIWGIGQEPLEAFLLTGSAFQPLLAALFGLIPSCASSILITELFLKGSLTFGAAVAGLSSSAGFGFLILFQGCGKGRRRQALEILLCCVLAAAVSGAVLDWLF